MKSVDPDMVWAGDQDDWMTRTGSDLDGRHPGYHRDVDEQKDDKVIEAIFSGMQGL